MSEETPEGGNAGFTPPASQDELNRIIADRLSRERAKFEAKFGDYDDVKQKAARLDEIEASNRTEIEKAQTAANTWEQTAQQAQTELARLRVATKYGITEDHLDLLGSGTEEELTARAERLAALTTAKTEQEPQRRELRLPGEGKSPDLPLNGDGIENALRGVLGIPNS